tara:strand:- start:278 stop:403 length:126 start_codon:yes stop_codon:yes gene_type:complete
MKNKNKTIAEAHAMTAEARATNKQLLKAAIQNNKIQFIEIK